MAAATLVVTLTERRTESLASLTSSRGHEAEREEAPAGRRAALGGSSFPPQRRTVVLVPGPGVLQLAQHRRTGRHPPAPGKQSTPGQTGLPSRLFLKGSLADSPLKAENPRHSSE